MKTVGYTCPFVPPEWIAAHGLSPVRLVPDGEAAPVRMGLCPYARGLGGAAAGRDDLDAVIVTTVCDQMRRLAERVADDGMDTFLMHVPATWQTPAAGRLYADELRRLGRFLVARGGQTPDDAKLAEMMGAYDDARTALRDARASLAPRRFAEALTELDPGRPFEAPSEDRAAGGVPLALVGGPRRQRDFAIFDLVDRFGGRIVLDATEGGEMTLPASFDRNRMQADPLDELVAAYFGSIPHAFRRPNGGLYEYLGRQLAERGAAGILYCRFVWCDTWAGELGRLSEWTDLPVLHVEVGDDDHAAARTASRIEAFLETLR
jgi:benzoyl-CoA reductase/2-hydroxyglutaryl-CoA dehydratase subunit BcrC/BadD/HgdB